jgi:hypothetical protein
VVREIVCAVMLMAAPLVGLNCFRARDALCPAARDCQ